MSTVLPEDAEKQTSRMIRVRIAAERYDLCTATIYRLIAAGAFPSIRVGRSLRIPEAALEKWIDAQINSAAPKLEGQLPNPPSVI